MPRFINAVRVQIICPCDAAPLFIATNRIIAALLDEERIQAWGGLTYSSLRPPAFTGHFWNEGRWEEDRSTLIWIDVPRGTAQTVLPYFSVLRDRISREYVEVGEPQKALWITAQTLRILWD